MELTPVAVSLGIGLAIGFAAGYNSHERQIQDCIDQAEQLSGYGSVGAKAFEFAQCMSPRHYDPQYDYKRFKGK